MDLRRTFDPFSVLWPAVDQWIKIRTNINENPMQQLNAEQITKDLQTIYQSLHKSTKNFRNGPTAVLQIATDLKTEVNEMKDHIPLLTALLNPGMKPRHWQKLSEELGFEFQLDDEITLKNALDMKLEDKIDIRLAFVCASFVSSVIAAAGYVFGLGSTPDIALGTSVLYLVPGVPYLNSMSDLLDGHYISFLSRFLDATVLTVCLSAGLCGGFLAMNLRWF